MHERALRTVLFIRSIDEGDSSGEVLSHAERAEATQAAAQSAGTISGGLSGPTLPPAAERLLVRRAELLQTKLEARSPVIGHVLELASGASWLGPAILAVAFVVGVTMSALDGRQRVDMLAFPLLGLIAWNLLVLLVLLAAKLRPRRDPKDAASFLTSAYARWIRTRADALLRRSSRFHVPLSEALSRFAQEWATIERPVLLLRAKRLFHLGAALVAFGLIVGLYVRGLVLRYDAGWESTFLEAEQVRGLLGLLYGPAAALSGIVLPSVQEVAALRWTETGTGAPAASWIHLIALTAVLYIVVPRLIAVAFTTAALWRAERNPQLPAAFTAYARTILRETGRVSGLSASVVTYAYAPPRDALAGLQALLADALGGEVKVEVHASVPYGEEDAFKQRLRSEPIPPAECHVLVMSLAATPESENHGAMIEVVKKALGRAAGGLLLVVDQSAYAARLEGDPTLATRLTERTRTWRDFAAARSQAACIVDLSRLRLGDTPDDAARKDVRAALSRSAHA